MRSLADWDRASCPAAPLDYHGRNAAVCLAAMKTFLPLLVKGCSCWLIPLTDKGGRSALILVSGSVGVGSSAVLRMLACAVFTGCGEPYGQSEN